MSSEVEICNLALTNIGAATIQSLTPTTETEESRKCNLYYAQTRDAVLADHPWGFATKLGVSLSLLTEETKGWTYTYSYPTDCLRALEVTDDSGSQNQYTGSYIKNGLWYTREGELIAPRIDFEKCLSADNSSNLLVTNQGTARLNYIARVTNTNLFSSQFVEMLSFKLAGKLAIPLKKDGQMKDQMNQEYALLHEKAATSDAEEAHINQSDVSSFQAAR